MAELSHWGYDRDTVKANHNDGNNDSKQADSAAEDFDYKHFDE